MWYRRKDAQQKRQDKIKEEKLRKHQELIEKQEKIKIERLQKEKEWKQRHKKLKGQKYLHEKIEEDYEQKVLMPELEKKKNELKEKRDFYKPIDHREIDEFQKKYEEEAKVQAEKKRLEREKWYQDIGQGDYDVNKYKTKALEKVTQREKGYEEIKIRQLEDKKQKAQKMNNYAKIVKEMHWPQVSPKKQKEILKIKNLLDQRNKRRSAPPKNRNVERKGSEDSDTESKIKLKRPVWDFHNPLVPKPKPKREPVEVDYLKELRIKREEHSKKQNRDTSLNWDHIKDQNIDDKTKIELLKARTKLIEENAERKEQMNKLNGATVEDNVDINDMLIDAIEMKLSILDQIE